MCYGERINRTPCYTVVSVTIYLLLSGVLSVDICRKDTSTEELTSALHQGALPVGQFQAGNFSKDTKATKLSTCILSCCNQDNCDAVFFFHNPKIDSVTCYLIQCNKTYSGSCDPGPKDAATNKTYFVNVRDVVYSQGGSTPAQREGSCNILSEKSGCEEHEVCRLKATASSYETECVCIKGYKFDEDQKICVQEKKTNKICDPSKSECGDHEECYAPSNLSPHVGICVCNKGYEKNDEGVCTSVIPSDLDITASKRNKSTNSPTTLLLLPTTTIKVTPLTVSAGKDKVIQLPINEVTLNAYVISKDEEEKKFDYEWSITSMPDGGEIGTMVGKNTDTLKLSKLIEGLYTFTIHVRGPHQSGEAFVNVTVLKAARQNTPPVAVIKPMNQEVKLPNSAILDGSDSKDDDKIVKYHWEEKSGPLQGQQLQDDTAMLTLKDLAPGVYMFELTVTDSDGASNSTVANVTVIKETDYPPKANAGSDVIIHLPQNSVILNGNLSTDDKGIEEYEWIKAADDKLTADMTGVRTEFLHLSNLQEGDYTFTLKVTDAAKQTSSAEVHVFVKPDVNHPPKADAGDVNHPQKADAGGTKTIYLGFVIISDVNHPPKADAGDVNHPPKADAGGTKTISLVVIISDVNHPPKADAGDVNHPPKADAGDVNHPPKADAGGTKTIYLPLDGIVLDASNSTDDKGITQYNWEQIPGVGGSKLDIKDPKAAVTKATGEVKVGKYIFVLTVKDVEGTSSVINHVINVKEHPNSKPVANAGEDQILMLPIDIVKLDGSKSSDDKGIVKYSWTRDPTSLAAGDPLNGSDHKAVLQLVNMVSGRYTFKLTVLDAEGLSSSDSASVLIRENPHQEDMIELDIDTDIRQFTEKDKENLQSQLLLMLPKKSDSVKTEVVLDHLEEETSSSLMKVYFHVEDEYRDAVEIRNGMETKKLLSEKLRSAGNQILSYQVINLDTIICQNNCSGHGHCGKKNRNCICDAFWMENFLKTLILHDESNCDWSILYFVIVSFLIVVAITAIVWGFICWCKNRRCRFRWRTKKRHRYSLLKDSEYKDEIKLLPKGKPQNSSVMISESDFSSEEETLFVNHKKNGFVKKPPNGISKQHLKNKLKA
ncbi:Dyslexia-associated protein KIAA0319-like protein,Dyslexia-associated protein KIAA0319 homolog,Dyslexia-associated protein KIAA0319 [Mytilus edulis]|uniref:Dyslexia-associated protein KIAA0319-like protein,Dyslexia-associated protein KIAA0319 homolog,Dyslexia-associated protein KIAA0319 n=1 Tax=Mytilus edulis TaxID=6550 RepID=A0A8S3R548_MYTED|nr:Dyslexia-associated protein KIAA0319-like protein,Dyslexia-associated protein KIAA0319 homolog,Dyslexia-associated protein KIAA0319 [Mytilus edulis]